VLIYDTDGKIRVLFPNPTDSTHRIEAGRKLTLPRTVKDPVTKAEVVNSSSASPPGRHACWRSSARRRSTSQESRSRSTQVTAF
jgi:hypothetical protein